MPHPFPTPSTIVLTGPDSDAVGWSAARSVPADPELLRPASRQRELRDRLRGDWSGWSALLQEIGHRLDGPPHACLVRGLPLAQPARVMLALTCGLGEVVDPYEQPWSKLVREIRPPTDRQQASRVLNERLHTDGTDWPRPNDLTCLLCVRADQRGGGGSRLLPIDGVAAAVAEAPGPARELLGTPLPWAIAEELGGGVVEAPALTADRVRWLPFTVRAAAGRVPADRFPSSSAVEELGHVEDLLETSPGVLEFALDPGDLLLVDNIRCLHSRTAVPDPARSERLVLRTKLWRRPDGRS
jgi:hypothetical protein